MMIPKLLGQSASNAATLTTLYVAPACSRTTIDTLTICNRSGTATTFRISVSPKGAADAVAHYLYYDTAIAGNATVNLTELNVRLTCSRPITVLRSVSEKFACVTWACRRSAPVSIAP